MKYRVKISGRALSEYEIGEAWWRVHREKAPELLKGEFEQAVALLAEHPETGILSEDHEEVRRVLLRKSRYALYYRVNQEENQVEILAFWHTSREAPEI
ncbi:MAG: type II toxin-antitoxin system RelE/ParE family toxin [Myxococcales bacterium]|nr:type II toxin-antitoxin system RelE/ParE family toxin [Myxococcales bacterium]